MIRLVIRCATCGAEPPAEVDASGILYVDGPVGVGEPVLSVVVMPHDCQKDDDS